MIVKLSSVEGVTIFVFETAALMSFLLSALRPNLNEHLYLRDPQATALGRRLLAESVRLLDEIGFEAFTFKKLAAAMNSTEASLYRYFENKHRLLTYLVSWHWAWLRLRVHFAL
jgi:hypothetical protein